MATPKTTQKQLILSHLQQQGSITQMQALFEYNTMRLASRISDLKKTGHDVRKVMVLAPSGRRYARYTLAQPVDVAA